MDDLDFLIDDNSLIGSDGAIIPANSENTLKTTLQTILQTPSGEDSEVVSRWDQPNRLKWCASWLSLSRLELPEYIEILGELPDLLLTKKPRTTEGNWVLERIKDLYKSLEAWLTWITKPDRPKPPHLEGQLATYESTAWLSNSTLNLCTAIHGHRDCTEIIKFLFHSPAHFWFWCEVAFCQQRLEMLEIKQHTEVIGKKIWLKYWSEQLKMLESRKSLLKAKRTKVKSIIDLLKRLYPSVLEWEALQIAEGRQNADFEAGPWAEYKQIQQHIYREARDSNHAEKLQMVYLYMFPNSSTTHLYVTGQGRRLPRSQGFGKR